PQPEPTPVTPDWGMRREHMSQSYTTRLDQLWVVKAKCSGLQS
ncbi:DUF4113 domain-containing protein, partial [Pseudomonas amygdali]